MDCDIENKTIKKDIFKCQTYCSLFEPKISYLDNTYNEISKQYLKKYKFCFKKCVKNFSTFHQQFNNQHQQ